jgi:16S rRNA (uracil1498-N3)-methyltransferase
MHLFYSESITGKSHILPQEESKHCIRVLRLKKGDLVHLTDGKGNLFETRVINDNDKHCSLEIVNVLPEFGKRNFALHLAVAPTKNISRFEWFLEKAAEIGIDSISPLICENSERRTVNFERLNKVLIAAMKQSLKAYLPRLTKPVDFKQFIRTETNFDRYIAYCSQNYRDELKAIGKPGHETLIFIGPEGDFSLAEIDLAISCGVKPVSLGPSRLRTETAAVVACVTINLLNQ